MIFNKGVGKIKKIQKSTAVGHKREKKVQLQASKRGTTWLDKLVGEGRPQWEKGIAEKLATCGSRRLKNTRVPARGSLFDVRVSSEE